MDSAVDAPRATPAVRSPAPAVALGAWGAALVAAVLAGRALEARGVLHLGAAPLAGTVRDGVPWPGLAAPIAVAAVVVAAGPRLAPRLGRRALPLATAGAAAAWAVALALVDGPDALAAPLTGPDDYLTDVGRVHDVPAFLSSFPDLVVRRPGVDAWATHVSGHPPGALLLFWGLGRIGLGGPGAAAAVLVLAGASAAAAVVVAVRALAGSGAAAAAGPLLALAPYALWVATSADAAFLAVSAWGAALVALAVTRQAGRRSAALATGGGVLLGVGLFLSYGLVPFGAVVVALLLARGPRRALAPAAAAALGVLAVVLAFRFAGFWWPDGLAATRIRWAQGWGSRRPYLYSLAAGLVVAGLAAGPAAVAALARFRTLLPALRPVVAGALAAVLLAGLSGMSRGEVERIWLPFLPWLLVAGVALARAGRVPRGWLVAQVACAVLVTAVVRTPW